MDFNNIEQLSLFDIFKGYYKQLPFEKRKKEGLRYYFDNDWFGYGDSISLYSMIRYAIPKRIIEIGSGYSSAVTLDTNEYFLNSSIQITFIEPYTRRLESLLKVNDKKICTIIPNNLQSVNLSIFNSLEKNDILFIDSSHIYSPGSDVEMIFNKILPILNKGVIIHFHDIMYPFIYPESWLSRGYNETSYVKNLLEKDDSFKIIFFNTYMCETYREKFEADMPLYLNNAGGSIWLQKK